MAQQNGIKYSKVVRGVGFSGIYISYLKSSECDCDYFCTIIIFYSRFKSPNFGEGSVD